MLGLPFFVVWENPAEHWFGDEIQTCNLWGQYKAEIWKTRSHYRPWTQGLIRIWALQCRTLAPHQAWNQGPIWVWAPRCCTPFITENWKYCNRIIFKCMNSIMEPNFKVVFVKKKILAGLVNSTWDPHKMHRVYKCKCKLCIHTCT